MKRLIPLTALFIVIFTSVSFAGNVIRFSIPLPLSGQLAIFGDVEKKSYEIAAEEINAAGGIKGRKVLLEFIDSKNDPRITLSIALKIMNSRQQPVIFGEYSSSCVRALATMAEERKVPLLVVSAAADEITQHNYKYVFRMNPPNSYYPSGMISFLKKVVHPGTIAILHEDSEFGTSGADDFSKQAEKAGMRVILRQPYSREPVGFLGKEFVYIPDIKVDLKTVKAAKPDVIYMISYAQDAVQLMKQLQKRNIDAKIFAGGAAGFAVPEFILDAKETAEYVVTTALWSHEAAYPGARQFAEKYLARYGVYPSYHGAEAYAALYVVKDVLERARSWNPKDVRKAMKATNMMTAFGPVKFEDTQGYTNQNFMETLVLQVIYGQYEVVWPQKFATQQYRYPIPKWKDR